MKDIAPDLRELLPRQAHSEPDERPVEMLWVYDPQEAKVYVENGEGDHPAHFPTHETMAEHVTHPERMQGYAYAIGGGWRVSDDLHHKVEDPYVLKQILAALRHEHPPAPLPHIRTHGDPHR